MGGRDWGIGSSWLSGQRRRDRGCQDVWRWFPGRAIAADRNENQGTGKESCNAQLHLSVGTESTAQYSTKAEQEVSGGTGHLKPVRIVEVDPQGEGAADVGQQIDRPN